MIGKVLAAVVGEELERRRGGSGLKGAAVGEIGLAVAKRAVPVALVIAGVFVAKKLVDAARGD